MTQQRLDEIRARCEAATAGPWRDDRRCDGVPAVHNGKAGICDTFRPDGQSVLDAEFIAHARQDIPDLLAEVERLTAELDAAKRDLKHSDNCDICAHSIIAAGCEIECHKCNLACICADCRDESLWEWRGSCAERSEHAPED